MHKFLLSIAIIGLAVNLEAQTYIVSTVAGTGTAGLLDGPAVTTAQLNHPYGLAYDGDSVIYFADGLNHVIRKISKNTGKVTTIAGNGSSGLVNGIGSAARFNTPDDVFYKNGFLYIGDNMNNVIRMIDISTYSVTTIAGTGVAGYLDGPVNQARFAGGNGLGIAVANNGDIYVADRTNLVIRKISGGMVSTVAGMAGSSGFVNGAASSAKFKGPRYLALDTSNGDLYITDILNHCVRKLSNGQVSTFCGTGTAGALDGPVGIGTLSAPVGIARTYNGYFYVVDGGGNKLRKVDPSGTISTIAGNGNFGFVDGPAANAEFNYPQDICYDKNCAIYISDLYNNRIRKLTVPEGPAGCSVGINSFEEYETGISAYPNPSQGVFNVALPVSSKAYSYRIMDALGKIVKTGELYHDKNQVDLSNVENGIYIISISQNSTTVTRKVTIQK